MKGLLFDFGGTLDTNGVHWSEEFRDVYRRTGVDIPKPVFDRAYLTAESRMSDGVVLPGDTLHTTLTKQIALQIEALQEQKSLRDRVSSAELPSRIVAGCYEDVQRTIDRVRPVLQACKRQFLLGLVSNFYGNLEAVCNELQIISFFKVIIDSAKVGARKPDPKIFRMAIDQLGTDAAETMVLGDSYDRDIVPAKTLGCTTVWLRGRSPTDPLDTSSADYVIYSFEAVRSFLTPTRSVAPH